jgi:hypothetical protein
MKQKQERTSLNAMWFNAFEKVFKNREILEKQFGEAKKVYPFFTQVFKLLLGYSGYLERRNRNILRFGLPRERGVPNIENGLPPGQREWPNIGIECAINLESCRVKELPEVVQDFLDYGDSEVAFEGMGDGSVPDPSLFRRSNCENLEYDYKKALACINELSDIESPTPEQANKLLECIETLNEKMNELIEAGCLNEYVADPDEFPPLTLP